MENHEEDKTGNVDEPMPATSSAEDSGESENLEVAGHATSNEIELTGRAGTSDLQNSRIDEILTTLDLEKLRSAFESSPPDAALVMAFESLSSSVRIAVLGRIRASGTVHIQKHLMVISGIMILALGTMFAAFSDLPAVFMIIPGAVTIFGGIAINISGKRTAVKEANYLAGVKTIEEADARAWKREEKPAG